MNLVALELDRVLFYLILRLKKVDSSIDISKKKKKKLHFLLNIRISM